MRTSLRFGMLLLCLLAFRAEADEDNVDRPFLQKLGKRQYVGYEDYVFPFLITQTATQGTKSVAVTAEAIRKFVAENGKGLPKDGRETKGELFVAKAFPLPGFVTENKQGAGIDDCTVKYCLMKLNISSEIQPLQAAPKEKRRAMYNEFIADRVRKLLSQQQLRGYEDRLDNIPTIQQSLDALPWFAKKYPEEFAYIRDGFWKNKKPPASLKSTAIQQEKLYLEIQKMQPVWRVAEVFEFEKAGSHLFFDLHVYSNHYFDSSYTIYEVLPSGDKSILVQTDVMELDELKKSGLIRMLYKGKMQEAVQLHQKDRLELWE